jgi:MOSC domain-containing protein YiiM
VRGRDVLTSIVRDQAPGPVTFNRGGPEGNWTAVHTEDVLATIAENYDHWARELGIARDLWPYAFWGENLTISGVSERELRIGDQLAIGSDAVFEITSPRIPCFKLAWRLGQPDSFLGRLTQSGLTGFYLRVLRPGTVSAGAAVVVHVKYPDNITVAELSRMLHDPAVDVERLRRALATPGLGRQATAMLAHRIVHLTDAARVRRGRWTGWRRFSVASVSSDALDVRSYVLRPVDGQPLAEYRAGQFLSVRVRAADGRLIARPWSLSDYEEGGRSYRLTIRRSASGHGSAFMHCRVNAGDEVDVKNPAGAFVLDRSTCRHWHHAARGDAQSARCPGARVASLVDSLDPERVHPRSPSRR